MTFDANSITDVQLDLSEETASIGQAAGDTLKQAILDAQGSEIDMVSGSTVTSKAVQEAAANWHRTGKGRGRCSSCGFHCFHQPSLWLYVR